MVSVLRKGMECFYSQDNLGGAHLCARVEDSSASLRGTNDGGSRLHPANRGEVAVVTLRKAHALGEEAALSLWASAVF